MLVSDVMQTTLTTVGPGTTLPEALRLMRERGIRHLPVLEHGKLVGIVSDRDLKRAMASPATSLAAQELTYLLERLRLEEIMTRTVITVSPTSPIEEAAHIMVQERISAMPVAVQGQLIGLVTETDVLRLFVRAMGASEPSSRLDVMLGRGRSTLAEVIQIIESAGAPVASVVTLASPQGLREAVVRIATIDPGPAIRGLEAAGYTLRSPRRRAVEP
jgi:acetoin utilization protein AcuB